MNKRVLSPTAVTTTVNGRSYAGVPGTPQDIPDFDADKLGANGWVIVAPSGPTASRPTNRTTSAPYIAGVGFEYFDTDLNALIFFDGLVWRNPVTGASV